MRMFAVGDIQGCYKPLRALLDRLRFDPSQDRLLLCGDLVNRGPESLQVLRYVRALGPAALTVLGNHDLHLLAVAHGGKPGRRDTLDEVLAAPDRDELLDWLRRQPLAWQEPRSGTLLIHAGLPPQWTVARTLELAAEAGAVLSGAGARRFLASMYGDEPDLWDESLQGLPRLRFIVNALTRLRYCTPEGRLALRQKGAPGTQPAPLLPWFEAPQRRSAGTPIVCGHWSTLGRVHWPQQQLHGLDTGCVWGGRLTALELGSGALHELPCPQQQAPGHEPD